MTKDVVIFNFKRRIKISSGLGGRSRSALRQAFRPSLIPLLLKLITRFCGRLKLSSFLPFLERERSTVVCVIIKTMRFGFLSTFALLVLGVVATPVQEESSTTIDVEENVSCKGSHFIVSVQRYPCHQGSSNVFRTDDVKEDSGELIAEKVSNIVMRKSWHYR